LSSRILFFLLRISLKDVQSSYNQARRRWELVNKDMAERIMKVYFGIDQQKKDILYESLKRFEKARKILEGTERE
jgi:hypothetical protein